MLFVLVAFGGNHNDPETKIPSEKYDRHLVQALFCSYRFLKQWKKNSVSRKPRYWRSDLVLNGKMTLSKQTATFIKPFC